MDKRNYIMLDILSRSIARAGGIEVADHTRIVPVPRPGKSVLRRLAGAFSRYRARKSTLKVLSRLNDRSLDDIGLQRGALRDAADGFAGLRAANDNAPQAPRAANDNVDTPRSAA
jgi:uncharacterized protein YjiS (DUF1127 family)